MQKSYLTKFTLNRKLKRLGKEKGQEDKIINLRVLKAI